MPIVALDPKGDLTNLGLVLPTLDAAAFRPWVDATEAARRGTTSTPARRRTGLDDFLGEVDRELVPVFTGRSGPPA